MFNRNKINKYPTNTIKTECSVEAMSLGKSYYCIINLQCYGFGQTFLGKIFKVCWSDVNKYAEDWQPSDGELVQTFKGVNALEGQFSVISEELTGLYDIWNTSLLILWINPMKDLLTASQMRRNRPKFDARVHQKTEVSDTRDKL